MLKCERGVQGAWDVIFMHGLAAIQRKGLANFMRKLTFSSAVQTIDKIITNIPPWGKLERKNFSSYTKTVFKSKVKVP